MFQADIVAQSRITFQEKELLQLIHSHLQSKGSLHVVYIKSLYITVKLVICVFKGLLLGTLETCEGGMFRSISETEFVCHWP